MVDEKGLTLMQVVMIETLARLQQKIREGTMIEGSIEVGADSITDSGHKIWMIKIELEKEE